jgi:hypothetical protein
MVVPNSKLNMKSTIKYLLFIVIIFTFTSIAFSQVPNYVPNNGLVGYWPFCGNANDESGNGNNGTVLGGASLTTDRFGNLNSAFLIDGLNCSNPRGVSVPVNILNDEYTFSVWCKSSDSTKTNQTILNTFPHNILALSLNYSLPEAQNKMCSFYGNGYWIDGGNIINWPSYQKENWKHFIVVKSQTQIAYYENGILAFNQPVNSLGNPVSISSIICGAISIMGGSSCYETFKGKVDDLIIWSRALTPTEISQLYTNPSVTPPVACTPFLGEDQTVCAGTSVTLSASGSSSGCGLNQNVTYTNWTLLFGGESVSNIIKGGSNYYLRTNSDVKIASSLSGPYSTLGFASQVNQNPGAQLLGFDNLNRLHVATGWECLYYLSNNIWTQNGLCGFGTGGQYFTNASNGRIVISKGGFLRSIYYSDNNGQSWTNATNIDVDWSHITKAANENLFAASAVGGSSSKGIIRSVDNGSSWQNINTLLQNITGASAITADCSGNLYAAGDRKLFKSADFGISWQYLSDLPSFFNQNPNYGDLLIAPNNAIYYSGYISSTLFGLFRSSDFGQTWSQVNEFNNSFSSLEIIDGVVIVMNANGMYGLSENSNSDIFWSNGATTVSINVTPTQTTTYTCSVTDANGNVCTDSVTIFVPQIEATDLSICAGESTSLSISGINSTSSTSACPTLPTNLQSGLVGYWPFCGNANDASGNGNNGTVNGATLTTDRFGNTNSAYSFDGNDYVSTAVIRGQLTSNFSISFYERYTGSPSAIYSAMIGGYDGAGGTQFFIGKNAGNTYLGIEDGNYNGNFTTNGAPFDGQWNHMVIVKIAGVIYLYRNGNLEAQGNFVGCNDSEALIFGNEFEGPGYFWNGQLDDIHMYNRSLSISEIQQLYNLSQTSYSWSNGATTPTITVSPSITTTYTCTTTTNGVSCTDSVTVVVNNPTIDLGNDVTVCGTSTTLTAPTGFDSYLWSNGATTNTTTVTSNGTYACTVTQGGCSVSDSIDVTLIDATISASDSTICAGETVTLSIPQVGSSNTACPTPPTNLQTGLVGYWPFCGNANDASGNGNNGTVNGATLTSDRFGNANGAYHFNGSSIITLNINHTDVTNYSLLGWVKSTSDYGGTFVQVGADDGLLGCNGFAIGKGGGTSLNNNLGNNLIALSSCVSWYPTSTQLNPAQAWHQFSLVKSNLDIKLFLDGVLVNTINNGAVNFPSPYIFIGGNGPNSQVNTKFFGDLDDITAINRTLSAAEIQEFYYSIQSTYHWSNGATTPTINVSPNSTTTYTCTTTTNGVSCTDSVTVVVNNPTIDLGNDVTVCGTSTTLTAPTGFDSYLWSNGATTNTTTVTSNGTYTCTVTQGGCSASDSIDVTLIDATITASDSTICAGETVTLSIPQGGSSNTACAALPSNLQTGLVGYWPFCGNANDDSGNGNNGTVNGATLTTDRFGSANSAYSFDGVNDGVQVAIPSIPVGSTSRSLSTWIYTSLSGNNFNYSHPSLSTVAAYGNSAGGPVIFPQLISNLTGNLYLETGSSQNQIYSTQPVNNAQWHNLITTYNGSVVKMYVDGILNATSNSVSLATAFSYLGIGVCPWATIHFEGKIDDVMLFNRALTDTEIQNYYENFVSHVWSNGATTQTINVSPTSTTTYTCTVTTNGVSCTDSVTVVVNNPPFDLGNDVTVCGTSTTLTAPTGYDSYSWSNGGTTNTTTVTSNGTYSCAVTQGGCSASDSIDVTLIYATISASDSVICAGETVTLSIPQGGSSNTACAALPTNLQTGLVGYWPFCGNANDASGNGNNGTVNGATLTTDRFGSANSAYSFDGVDDYVSTNLLGIIGQNSRTIGFWFNSNNNNSGIKTMFGYGEHSSAIPHGSRFDCTLETGKPSIDIGYSFASYTVPNIQNNWKYYTVTYNMIDGVNVQAIKLYIDGVLQSSPYLLSNSVIINTGNLNSVFFGAPYSTPSGNSFNGQLDDIAIYNRALSTSEIQQLYNLEQITYLWSNGATTPTINISPTSTTTYTCTTTTNGVSCSSNYTITVNNSSASTNIVTAFDSFTWLDGNTYTASNNTATYTTTNAAGCDSVISLNLTITPSSPTLSLQVFLDGYYTNSSNPAAMTAARYNNLVASGSTTPGAATDVDVITVELRSPSNLDVVAYSVSPILQTNGSVQCVFPAGALGGSFYIVVKHRAAIPLWSAVPMLISNGTAINFSNNVLNSFSDGDPLYPSVHELNPGLYGLWMGELYYDSYLDGNDYPLFEVDVNSSSYADLYLLNGDLNGNTYVDASDYSVFNYNSQQGVYEQRPYAITTNVSIGQSYQGGIVAYILQPGDIGYDANVPHGLIAAPSDLGYAQYGCPGTTISGADGTAIGTGAQNTIDIMNVCSEAGIAARLCGDLVLGGYSDWYLPSKDELNQLYINKVAIGGFANNFYWSSTELDINFAWVQYFFNGNRDYYYKYYSNVYASVRAVRAF